MPARGARPHLRAALALALMASQASAHERETSEYGAPVRWPDATLPLPSTDLGPRAQEALERALHAWTSLPCAGLRVDRAPWRRRSVRVTLVRHGWPHDPSAAAYTTLDADRNSGALRGATVELNGAFSFGPGPDELDLEAILTHELGHVLGLAHSHERQAVMYLARRTPGAVRRPLHADDIAGLCAIYPGPLPPRRIAREWLVLLPCVAALALVYYLRKR